MVSVELAGRHWKIGTVWALLHYKFCLDNKPLFKQCHGLCGAKPINWILLMIWQTVSERVSRHLPECNRKRIFLHWILCWFPASHYLSGGNVVAYTGLIKRETSKALHAVINFVVVFVLSASFIAYAPDYIKKINEFSSDISTASLDLGTKIMLPNSDSEGKDSVDFIRDSLFSIQWNSRGYFCNSVTAT